MALLAYEPVDIDSSGIGSDTNSGTVPLNMDGRVNAPQLVLAGEALMEAPNLEAPRVAQPINVNPFTPPDVSSSFIDSPT